MNIAQKPTRKHYFLYKKSTNRKYYKYRLDESSLFQFCYLYLDWLPLAVADSKIPLSTKHEGDSRSSVVITGSYHSFHWTLNSFPLSYTPEL